MQILNRTSLYYFIWQIGAYKLAKRLVLKNSFDYCIHLSFGSMWMPTFMYRLPIPFIWGPVGGGEAVPFSFIGTLPWKTRLPQYVRYLLMRSVTLNPLYMGPCRAAKAIIARTEDSQKVFPARYRSKVSVMLETGITDDVLQQYKLSRNESIPKEVKLICIGRLVAFKNIEMAIRSLAAIHKTYGHVRLTIVGDGPLKKRLMDLARNLSVQGEVDFVGALPHQQAISAMQRSDILLFPSLREGGSWALMEAMALGLPVICLDTSGMHIITDNHCCPVNIL